MTLVGFTTYIRVIVVMSIRNISLHVNPTGYTCSVEDIIKKNHWETGAQELGKM